jgi:hypothetical protein
MAPVYSVAAPGGGLLCNVSFQIGLPETDRNKNARG